MNTSFPLDMAIAGEGFFVLNGEQVGRPGQTLFSRAGQFRVDKDGFVVNPSGARLQGQPVGANDELQSTTADLAVQRTNIAPRQTTEISLALNLDARTAVRGGLGGVPFDVNDPDATSDYATTVSVFDSLGKPYDARLYFERTSNTTWDAHILIDGVEIQTQQFTFQQNGALVSNVTTQAGNWNPTPPATQGVAFNFDAGTTFDAVTGTGGLDGITSFGSASTIVTQSQDGYASGALVSIDLARDGLLRGNYTNGKSLVLGQVTLAQFQSRRFKPNR